MITGNAPTGSSTPPIWAAAAMWTFLPTCAQEPTSAWESIIEPSSTYAPILTYAGGIMITEGARYAPLLTELPPGTIRTLSSTVKRLAGMVSLSMKDNPPSDISVSFPRRKPVSIISLIQELTFHSPSTFSATLIFPASRSWQTLRNSFISLFIIVSIWSNCPQCRRGDPWSTARPR